MNIALRVLVSILILAICSIAFAQSGYEHAQEIGSGNGANISSRSIFRCSDNSVVTIDSVEDTDDLEELIVVDIAITKLDPFGSLLWRRYFYGQSFLSVTGVDIDANDTVTFITTQIWANDYINLWTIDSSGIVTRISEALSIPNSYIACFTKALRIANNEIVAVGKSSYTAPRSACFYRFSATGELIATALWPVDIDNPSYYDCSEAYDLALKDNGNLIVSSSMNPTTASVLEIDIDGNIINRIDFADRFLSGYSTLAISKEANQDSYLLAGVFGEYPDHAVQVYRLQNNELNLLFDVEQGIIRELSSLLAYDNGLIICGSYNTSQWALVNLSLSGEVNWYRHQPGGNINFLLSENYSTQATDLIERDEDGCVYWTCGDREMQLITKLLPNGQVPVADEVQIPPATIISAYPNPMKDEIKIKIKQDNSLPIQGNSIEIFNIKGQLIRSLELTKGETVWDGKDNGGKPSPKGIYLLRSEGTTRHLRKIVKTR